jgi:serine/threonine protein kinase
LTAADPDLYLELEEELAPQILPAGTVVADRYNVVEVLGRGGMGIVYKAQQIHMERLVAMKMVLEQTNSASSDYRRFQREAKAASLLDHPNIVKIHDFGFAEGQAYLCMEYLQGASLDIILRKGPLRLDEFRHVFAQACDALQHAHDRGIVHRDLKPSNLLLTERRDDKLFLVILDFGLVKMVDGTAGHKLTATNMVLGSPLYMSPEQCRATALDYRSDIYSLACVMYEALTGLPPLTAETVFDVMNLHITTMPKPMRDAAPGVYVPPALERVIMQALSKNPDERQSCMAELAQGIERSFSGAPDVVLPSAAAPKKGTTETVKTAGKTKKRSRTQIILSGVAMALAVVLLISVGMLFDEILHPEKLSSKGRETTKITDETAESQKTSPPRIDSVVTNVADTTASAGTHSDTISGAPEKLNAKASSLFSGTGQAGKTSEGNGLAKAGSPETGSVPNNATALNFASAPAASTPTSRIPESSISSNKNTNWLSPSHIPPSETGGLLPQSEAAQIRAQANNEFYSGRWSNARRLFEEALSKSNSSEMQTQILAKLVCCASNERDQQGTKDYLDRFKDAYNFNSRALESDPELLSTLLQISRQQGSSENIALSEALARGIIEASNRRSEPTRNSIRAKLELHRLLRDQEKNSEADSILQEALRDAQQIGDQNAINNVTSQINQANNRPGPGMGGRFAPPLPPPPGGGGGNGPPGFGNGPPGNGPNGGPFGPGGDGQGRNPDGRF